MGSGEYRLGLSALSLQCLGDGTNLVSDFGVLVDLSLEVLEDSRIYHSGSHVWRCIEESKAGRIFTQRSEYFTFHRFAATSVKLYSTSCTSIFQ